MQSYVRAIAICSLSLVSALAMGQGNSDNDTPPLTAAQTAQSKAERLAAQAQWAGMTAAQKADVTRAMQMKRLAHLSALEAYSDNDTQALTPEESAELKSMRAAARAKWAAMSPDEKTAMRKAARQRMLAELTTLEKVAGAGS